MLKDETRSPKKQRSNNGVLEELSALIQTVVTNQNDFTNEVRERLEEVERKNSASGEAQLLAAKLIYDTPRDKKRAFTNVSRLMVDPFSLADTCAAVLTDDVQAGKVSLGQVRRESIFDLLGSVKGWRANKGAELAQQQEINKIEGSYEEADLGKRL